MRDYLIGCIEADEDLVELGYNENEKFIDDVVEEYESNLKYIEDSYSEIDAKDDKIAYLTAKLNKADLAASQAAQNTYLISELKPCPQPAYVVPNPYCNCGSCYN